MVVDRELTSSPVPSDWPAEVDLILSAMDAGLAGSTLDRRAACRRPYRSRAELKLYADRSDAAPRLLYLRDADARGAGFITRHLLPLGYGGWVTLTSPTGDELHAECVIYRCRKTVEGWYEGAMRFSREAWQLDTHTTDEPAVRQLRIAP